MKFSFKKVSAILSSVVMLGASVGVAAAANYPNPFVVGGTANVAIVYGTGSGVSTLDTIQAGNIQSNLQTFMSSDGTSETSITGETAELFSGGTKIYINDSLNTVKSVITKSSLPTVLADGSFSGDVDATFTQKIDIGSDPRITFARQPTSSDDPSLALTLTSASSGNKYIYNSTVTFNKAVAFSDADSEGEELEIFGSSFTVGSATDNTSLVLLKSAEKVSLTNDNPTADVTIAGATYTIELISASDTAATIAVTDSSGKTESKEINEAASKKINGITIAITNADESNFALSASVIAGSDKVTLKDNSALEVGEDSTLVDGTLVSFGGRSPANITTLTISVYAPESDEDAILSGESFTDPVYGTFKLDFAGFNIDSTIDSTSSSRETIKFNSGGDSREEVTFTDHRGYTKTLQFAKNYTAGMYLMGDDNGKNITVLEGEKFHKGEFVVVGNEDEGYFLELIAVRNQSGGVTGDKVDFRDTFSGTTYSATLTDDGAGTIDIGGKVYSVTLEGISGITDTSYNVSLGYPDGTGANVAVIYPTIQTSKGAKVMFYEPKTIVLPQWTDDVTPANLTELKFPNGADGYASLSGIIVSNATTTISDTFNFTATAGVSSINTSANQSFTFSVGQLTYNISGSGGAVAGQAASDSKINIRLLDVAGTANIDFPAIIIFEEKDDNAAYEALIVEIEGGEGSTDGMGVSTVESTWSQVDAFDKVSRYSDSKYEDGADLWGSIFTIYSGDSDQKTATISYPDEQVFAQLYMAEESATITTSGSTTGVTSLGEVLVKDTEVSSVSSKNLVIVGGSCINSAAAKVLGGAYCSADFTDATGVGSGEFLIKGVSGAYTTGKIALVVAGYDAADTVNAAKYLTTQTVDTSKEYKGTSATAATLVTTETA